MNRTWLKRFRADSRKIAGPGSLGRVALIAVVMSLGLSPTAVAADIQFEAFDLKTGQLMFRGKETSVERNGVVTEKTAYQKADGTPIQQVEVSYRQENLKLISYRKTDLRTGEREVMIAAGDDIKMTYLPQRGAAEDSDSLRWSADTAFSASMAPLMRRSWDRLRSGAEIQMNLLVPSRLDTVQFRVRREGEAVIEGQAVAILRVEPATWLIRQLVDPLRFYMSTSSPHRVLEYRGRTTVKTEDGDPLDARVVYRVATP